VTGKIVRCLFDFSAELFSVLAEYYTRSLKRGISAQELWMCSIF
jgi:hypothetical protein